MADSSHDDETRRLDADEGETRRIDSDETRQIDPKGNPTVHSKRAETRRMSGWASDPTGSDATRTGHTPSPPPPPPASGGRGERIEPAPQGGWRASPDAAPPPPPAYPRSGRRAGGKAPAPAPAARVAARGGQVRQPAFWPSFARTLFIMAILAGVAFTTVLAVGAGGYVYIASQLPSPEDLSQRATELFTSSQIYDRDGNLLFELLDPQGGRRTVVELDHMSKWVRQATIDTEDPRFYRHPGFDPIGIVRAVIQNLREGETVSGASTIAQQLVRNLMLPPEERAERTANRKIKEAVLAAEVTRRYPRDKILELYLNSVYFGNLAYGVEAAAQTYFQKDAEDLTLAEGSFIAGLVQAPSVYDPYTPDGREAALARHRTVLRLMVEAGSITREQAGAAAEEMAAYEFKPPRVAVEIPSPHFVQHVRQIVETHFGPEALYRGGLKIYTTLDPELQSIAEDVVQEQIAGLADRNVYGGALVAMEPNTGRVLAMVGSPDYRDEQHAGQINMAVAPRQTGSAIKPLNYLAAFEKGWTPSTAIWDTPVVYTDTAGNVYRPVNYDGRFHGPQPVRSALANSYNVPAVKTLEFVTVPEFLKVAQRFGITTFTRPDYGLSLTLGGGEAPLIEMAGAFQIFANGGVRRPPVVIERITNVRGDVQCQFALPGQDAGGAPPCESAPGAGEQVISPQHAYLITHILSDNLARCPAFGCPNILEIGRPAAVKTGTTNDFRDNWTIGYTPELVTGVWIGNPDRSEMKNISGVTGAGPIWHNFMQRALEGQPVLEFPHPPGIIEMEVCADSGTQPSPYCPARRTEIFAADRPPLGPEHDWYQLVRLDAASGLRWVEGCTSGVVEKVMAVVPPEGFEWAQQHGLEVAPIETCAAGPTASIVAIGSPPDGGFVDGVVPVIGTATIPDFESYDLQFASAVSPDTWRWISGPHLAQVVDGELTQWDTNGLEDGEYILRLVVHALSGGSTEARVRVFINRGAIPTPTDTPGPTATPTPAPTETPVVVPTLPPSTETPMSEPTLPPADTVEPTPTP
ncbi:MAG TPA: PBP1A family penicillin-binding protein [Anaerolineae bacterium]|nr:PBP1A family penicillin-binding protein [Anaerolineae bacterium]